MTGAFHHQALAVAFAPPFGALDPQRPAEILAGQRCRSTAAPARRLPQPRPRPRSGPRPARDPRCGRRSGWSPRRVPRRGSCSPCRAVPASVSSRRRLSRGWSPIGRLVQDIEHAAQPRADLRGEPDALPFAAGKRRGRAVQREVAHPDIEQELEPFADLGHDRPGDFLFAVSQLEPLERACSAVSSGGLANSEMVMPFSRTARLSGRNREPPHAGQFCTEKREATSSCSFGLPSSRHTDSSHGADPVELRRVAELAEVVRDRLRRCR